MIKAYTSFWLNFANFKDRTSLKGYWLVILCNILIGLIFGLFGFSSDMEIIFYIYSILLIVPSAAISVRRLHDSNKSGWLYFLGLIPVVGVFILIYFFILPSVDENNKYGSQV